MGAKTQYLLFSVGRRLSDRVKASVLAVQEYILLSWRALSSLRSPPRYSDEVLAQMDSLEIGRAHV